MEHQDWTPVVFHKPNQTNQVTKMNKNSGMTKQTRELINSNDIVLPAKLTPEFRKAMQNARNAKKISQKQLATILQVPPKTIMEYENGKAIPNNQFISKMERVLQTKLPRPKKNKIKE